MPHDPLPAAGPPSLGAAASTSRAPASAGASNARSCTGAGTISSARSSPLPGSAGRLLTYENGVPVWEGKPIGKDDPFPEK